MWAKKQTVSDLEVVGTARYDPTQRRKYAPWSRTVLLPTRIPRFCASSFPSEANERGRVDHLRCAKEIVQNFPVFRTFLFKRVVHGP